MEDTLQGLVKQLAGDNGMERKRAREALVLAGDAATTPLVTLLESEDKRLRWEAAKALSVTVDPAALPALVALLHDQESDLRWLAADGLIGLGPRSIEPVLTSLLTATPTKGQLQMAGRVLRRFASENSVLEKLLDPVLEVLDDAVTPDILQPRVSEALGGIERATGRLPSL